MTIGIQVYNGEKVIGERIKKILNQTFQDFVIVISDNNSNDKPKYNLEISNDIPEYALDNHIYTKLNKYKTMIDSISNIKVWDFCKKLSNDLFCTSIKLGREVTNGI